MLKLPRGKSNLELRYSVECNAPDPKNRGQSVQQDPVELARGTLQINVTEDGLAKYAAANGLKMESTKFADSAAVKHIAATARTIPAFAGKPIVAVFMRQGDWSYERNEYGRILSRYADGTAVARDGQSCKRVDFRAVEKNTGASDYVAQPMVEPEPGENGFNPTTVPCSAIPGK